MPGRRAQQLSVATRGAFEALEWKKEGDWNASVVEQAREMVPEALEELRRMIGSEGNQLVKLRAMRMVFEIAGLVGNPAGGQVQVPVQVNIGMFRMGGREG